ncbi:Rieske (2Fe-2S) protein [Mongoliimonas terrestris]|uniref:Rieske (2Fe-2S) protein n=1 Tax=Mongoliimonas terrestris TaxID=1709001 RepID=UPI000949B108|nr:Rieske (2Fe-2S) protein [Mongoliimonas terrestris]
MSVALKPVGWNRNKLVYDAVLIIGAAVYILAFLNLAPMLSEGAAKVDAPIQRMRAFGSLAFLMLTLVLAIGPLARLDTRFLPLLYNRRHFGVITALVATTHAVAVLDWYYAFSPTPQLLALFTANTSFDRIAGFPFEILGVAALLVLAVLAATSHDFWLSFLTPPVWKALHMSVYGAYGAVVLHVALGPMAGGRDPVLSALVAASVATLATLHLVTGRRERAADAAASPPAAEDGWIDVGDVSEIAEARAIVGAAPGGERIAVFRTKDRLVAISNVCSHQNGPIGEGKVVRGFITCPWHGYQYRPEDGCSPPPFRERIHRYPLRLNGSRVEVATTPVPLGTRLESFRIPGATAPASPVPRTDPPGPRAAAPGPADDKVAS